MKKIELNMRMLSAEKLISDVSEYAVALLSEAAGELEIALDILQDFDDPRAEKFMIRHSTDKEVSPMTPSISEFQNHNKLRAYITNETVTRKND